MESLYGIGTTFFPLADEEDSTQDQHRRSSSISLDDCAKNVDETINNLSRHYRQHSVQVVSRRQQQPYEPLKSPLGLIRPTELQHHDDWRPATPSVDCPLLPSRASTPSVSNMRPMDVWVSAEDSHEDRLAQLAFVQPVSSHRQELDRQGGDGGSSTPQPPNINHFPLEGPPGDTRLAGNILGALKGLIILERTSSLEWEPHYVDQLRNPVPYNQPQSDLPYSISVQAPAATDERSDSSMSDLPLPEGLPAARHIELDRMLKDAGIAGLGDCNESRVRYSRTWRLADWDMGLPSNWAAAGSQLRKEREKGVWSLRLNRPGGKGHTALCGDASARPGATECLARAWMLVWGRGRAWDDMEDAAGGETTTTRNSTARLGLSADAGEAEAVPGLRGTRLTRD
ncbi:hypothetical protein B0I35DRAFT_410639 [Stachybotrys elegans]|uniref:Uncharacterized protein n=1 Tax=Stachybotrys elegans TaxID=80388 RepID=A0A8K0SNM6_9HYPO|nr:hypothetical protein B0I35DRAFT_410639 [Stachybotrys elegans]